MTSEINQRNEKIKISVFLSMLSILFFIISSYLSYFYHSTSQRLIRGDNASNLYIAITLFIAIVSLVIALKSIRTAYKNIMG